MTWRGDRPGLELELLDGTVLDVIVEHDDAKSINASDRYRAVLMTKINGYAHTGYEAKLALAAQLERVADRIRREVMK